MKLTHKLIDKLSSQTDSEYTLLTGNGTTALYSMLSACQFKGKKIGIPNNVCLTVLAAILYSGNNPYYLNVDLKTGCIDMAKIKDIDDPDIVAIVFPYMYGQSINILEMSRLCKQKNWLLIEDYAQSYGISEGKDKKHLVGDAAILSFGASKILGVGHGGAFQTNNQELAKSVDKILLNNAYVSDKTTGLLNLALPHFVKLIYNNVEFNQISKFADVFKVLFELYRDDMILSFDKNYKDKIYFELNRLDEIIDFRLKTCEFFRNSYLNHPHIKIMEFAEGSVPWKFNIFVDKKIRNPLLKELLTNKCQISSWYFPLSRFYPIRQEINDSNDLLFADTILNLAVDNGISKNYCTDIVNLINNFIDNFEWIDQ